MAGTPPLSLSHRIDVFWHEGMLNHDTGSGVFDTGEDPGFLDVLDKHPENSDRIKNMVSILKRGPLSPFITWHYGRHALLSELLSFHHQGDSCFNSYTLDNWGFAFHLFKLSRSEKAIESSMSPGNQFSPS